VAEVQLTDEQRKTLQRWSRRVTSAQALPRPWSSAAGFLCMKIGYNPSKIVYGTVHDTTYRRSEWRASPRVAADRTVVAGETRCQR
jgi:hypothetical protein